MVKRINSKRKSQIEHAGAICLLLGPLVLFYICLIAYPVFRNVYSSFFEVRIINAEEIAKFVGLDNFKAVFSDDTFWKAARNSLSWAFASPFLEIPIALLLAVALKFIKHGYSILRTAWFLPVMLPQVVVGIIWTWVYNYDWGALNTILRNIGFSDLCKSWLGTPETALPSLIFVTTWIWVGFNMVIILSAISAIPDGVIEAATIDGASRARQLFSIIIPLVRPTLINLLILCFIGKMKVYDLIMATTEGGPLWATETVATYTVKRAFYWATFDRGFPSAMSTIWFLLILIISTVTTWLLQRKGKMDY